MNIPTVCAKCRVRPVPADRSVCEVCYPPAVDAGAYYTPASILEPACGSGAFISNPPAFELHETVASATQEQSKMPQLHGPGDGPEFNWRQQLREFASDREQHQFDLEAWREFANDSPGGITLYSSGDYFVAYHDDAAELWERGLDDHPMFHVMVKSDPPHRCCIHAIHLAAWVQLLASVRLPVQIIALEDLKG